MEMNLHILAEDLRDLGPNCFLTSSPLRLSLKTVNVYIDGVPLESDRLYLAEAKQLAAIKASDLNRNVSLLVIGEPPEAVLNSKADIIWFAAKLSKDALQNRLHELFYRYSRWHLAMQQAISRNKPLRNLGEIAAEALRRPIWLYDRNYQTIFHVASEFKAELPSDYVIHKDGESWPLWEINAWNEGAERIGASTLASNTEPYILPSTDIFSYRALAYNLFMSKDYAATITIDEIGGEINARDRALLKFVGDLMMFAIKRHPDFNLSMPGTLKQDIAKLLARQQVTKTELLAGLAHIAWGGDDGFVCLVARPSNQFYTDPMLALTAEKVCEGIGGLVDLVHNHMLVILINLKLLSMPLDNLLEQLAARLCERHLQTRVGVSSMFVNISTLFCHYQQALVAISLDDADDPQKFTRFDDHILEYVLRRCTADTLPEILFPSGLTRLMEHDRCYNSDLTNTMRVYLENNLSVANTSRILYMHRNTVLTRIKACQEILAMCLQDPINRTILMLALNASRLQEGDQP